LREGVVYKGCARKLELLCGNVLPVYTCHTWETLCSGFIFEAVDRYCNSAIRIYQGRKGRALGEGGRGDGEEGGGGGRGGRERRGGGR
jgi:hypothetical protein